jgi:hypothetical protein
VTREETAELVGRYFGLQKASNLKIAGYLGPEAARVHSILRALIDDEMSKVEAKLPPGTIDTWPRQP